MKHRGVDKNHKPTGSARSERESGLLRRFSHSSNAGVVSVQPRPLQLRRGGGRKTLKRKPPSMKKSDKLQVPVGNAVKFFWWTIFSILKGERE